MSTPLGRICRRSLLIVSALASGLPAPGLWQFVDVAEAHESSEATALRDYRESTHEMASRISQLMGERVKLPGRGDVVVRQSLAPNGRVMKRLLMSKELSELQMDENADGVMDLWEVKKGSLTVSASDPLGGRFMRLTISDKVSQGILKAEYMLSRDGQDYALWRATIERATIFDWRNDQPYAGAASTSAEVDRPLLLAQGDSVLERIRRRITAPTPTPAPASTPVVMPAPGPRTTGPIDVNALVDTRGAAEMQQHEIREQAMECDQFTGPLLPSQAARCQQLIREWRNFGDYIGLGDVLLCDANREGNQLARLQMSWWGVLQTMNGQENLLNRMRNPTDPANSMFSSSCFAPERRADFEGLTSGLAEIMGTSAGLDRSVVQPGSTPSPDAPRSLRDRRGPFLGCLERNGLAGTAARIEREFYMSLEFPELNRNKPIACDFNEQRGANNPGSFLPGHNQIQVRMLASQDGQSRDYLGTPLNYANVLFHEYIHASGISSEPFTHTAVACCGNPPGSNQEQACQQMRGMVNEELRVRQLEVLFGPNVHNSDSVYRDLHNTYGPDVADRLVREFLLGLDRNGGIISGYGRIMDPDALRACVAREGQEACVNRWVDGITRYQDRFVQESCPNIIDAAFQNDVRPETDEFRRQCAAIGVKIRGSLAQGMRQMIQATAAGTCQRTGTRADAGSRDATRWLAVLFGVLPAAEASASGQPVPDPCAFAGQEPQPGYTAPAPPTRPVATPPPDVDQIGLGDQERVVPHSPGSGPTSRNDFDSLIPPSNGRDRLANYNQRPSSEISQIAPRPVVRIDTESRQGVAAVERRLREATDFVGAAARGFEKLKEVAIPTAQASERANPSRIASATEAYVPFSAPMRTQENGGRVPSSISPPPTIASADSPGASRTSPAAVRSAPVANVRPPQPGSANVERGGASLGASVGTRAVGSGAVPQASSPALPPSSAITPPNSTDGGPADLGTTPAHLGAREPLPARNPAAGSQAQIDLLAPLLTRPWREVSSNLKNPTIVQALVDQRIVIIDPSGRRVGSRVPQRTYRFVGLDKPLKVDRRVPASRP